MTGVVLAGGRSKRMGLNKAFLEIDGERIISRVVTILKGIFDDVVLVTNDPLEYEDLDVRTVTDIFKGAGSLGGIYTGLFHAHYNYSFITACDMPFLKRDVILRMMDEIEDYDTLVPYEGDRFHPFHAIYSKGCLKAIEGMIKGGELRIIELYKRVRAKRLEGWFKEDTLSLYNINTPEDLEKVPAVLKQGKVLRVEV